VLRDKACEKRRDADGEIAGEFVEADGKSARFGTWTYTFLVVIQLLFLIDPPGRSLGVDVRLRRRETEARKSTPILSLVS